MNDNESVELLREKTLEWISQMQSTKAIRLIYGFVEGLIKRGEK